jgi:hypothetical protein
MAPRPERPARPPFTGIEGLLDAMADAGVARSDLVATRAVLVALDPVVADEVVTTLADFPDTVRDPFLRVLPLELSHLPWPRRDPQTPVGEQITFELDDSAVFPGTRRTVSVWVPRGYVGGSRACVHVNLDGLYGGLCETIDELVARGEMPMTIGVGIPSGTLVDARGEPLRRRNRNREFDTVSGELAAFVLDEVLPRVDGLRTSDGRVNRLSERGADRSVAGGSSGAPAAFGMAWHRPDAFSRVLSLGGTYVGLRGNFQWPLLVRKSEPRPIRVFLQDGSNDWVDGPVEDAGDWWLGNLTMEKALAVSGYDVQHSWGEGQHFSWHARAVLFEAFRWLWRDHPADVETGPTRSLAMAEAVSAGDRWEPVAGAWGDIDRSVPDGISLDDIVGVAVSPTDSWAAVTRRGSRHGLGFRLSPEGTALTGDRFYRFLVVDDSDEPGVGAVAFDESGRLFGASSLGVQIFDRAGNARVILDSPVDVIVDLRVSEAPDPVLEVLGADGRAFRRRIGPWSDAVLM